MPPTPPRPAPRRRDAALALYPLALVGLTLLALASPRRDGAVALAQVFAHFLFAPALLLLPLALARGMFLLRIALAAAAAVFLLVYPPALNLAAPPAAPDLRVLSWNVFVGGVSPGELRAAVAEHDPDVVLLQELLWDEIAGDPELAARYPHQLLRPGETAPSLAILSRHPIVASGVPELPGEGWDMERIVWARIDLGGRTVTVVNAHPIPPRTFEGGCSPLSCYNRGPRDAQIAQMRAFADELRRQTGDPLVLAGDMNVTEREEAYFELAAGLQDLHRAAGSGFGASWRPGALGLPAGLLRIDYIFATPGLRPLGLTTDCALRGSDHCLLLGDLALTGAPVAGGP